MGLGKCFALGPGDEIFERAPPRFDLVIALGLGVFAPFSGVAIEPHRLRAVDFVADEAGRLVHEMDPTLEAILKVDFVPGSDRDAVGSDNHEPPRSIEHAADGFPARILRASPIGFNFNSFMRDNRANGAMGLAAP